MEPDSVERCVKEHFAQKWKERDSCNIMRVVPLSAGRPWTADPNHPNYKAGILATQYVYGVTPDMTREGGSIPVTLTLQEATGKNVMLLPVGAGDDGAHSQNEKLDVRNYIQGVSCFFIRFVMQILF